VSIIIVITAYKIKMAISYESYIKSNINFEEKRCKLSADVVMDLLGHELKFFQLWKYVSSFKQEIDVKIAIKKYENLDNVTIVTIWIDDYFVENIKLEKNNNSKLLYEIKKLEKNIFIRCYTIIH
jgi:hypothetical protein